jgi:hypothetical protein
LPGWAPGLLRRLYGFKTNTDYNGAKRAALMSYEKCEAEQSKIKNSKMACIAFQNRFW